MYIIKLKCLILADYFSQCFCWDNLHVTVISFEPILTVVEEKQSRDMCRLEGIQFLITALLCLTLPWADVCVGPWFINNGCIGKGRKLDTLKKLLDIL